MAAFRRESREHLSSSQALKTDALDCLAQTWLCLHASGVMLRKCLGRGGGQRRTDCHTFILHTTARFL